MNLIKKFENSTLALVAIVLLATLATVFADDADNLRMRSLQPDQGFSSLRLVNPQGIAVDNRFQELIRLRADEVSIVAFGQQDQQGGDTTPTSIPYRDACDATCEGDPDCVRRCQTCTENLSTSDASEIFCFRLNVYAADQGAQTIERISTSFRLLVQWDPEVHVSRMDVVERERRTVSGQRLQPGYCNSSDDGCPAGGQLNAPTGLALDAAQGRLYVSDTNNAAIRTVDLNSCQPDDASLNCAISTLIAGDAGLQAPAGIARIEHLLAVADAGTAKLVYLNFDPPLVTTAADGLSGAKWLAGWISTGYYAFGDPLFLFGAGDDLQEIQYNLFTQQVDGQAKLFPGPGLGMLDFDANGPYRPLVYFVDTPNSRVIRRNPCLSSTRYQVFVSANPADNPVVLAPPEFSNPVGMAIIRGAEQNPNATECSDSFSSHFDNIMILLTANDIYIVFDPRDWVGGF